MKRFIYLFIKRKVLLRFNRIRLKQLDREVRIRKVMLELSLWQDIPLSHQMSSLCEILRIKPDKAAYNFLVGLLIGEDDVKKIAKKIPLI